MGYSSSVTVTSKFPSDENEVKKKHNRKEDVTCRDDIFGEQAVLESSLTCSGEMMNLRKLSSIV